MEQQTTCGITGINILINDQQMHLLVLEFVSHLAQMKGGTGQTVQSGHHQIKGLPGICQAGL